MTTSKKPRAGKGVTVQKPLLKGWAIFSISQPPLLPVFPTKETAEAALREWQRGMFISEVDLPKSAGFK